MTAQLSALFLSACVTFFVVIDPPGCAPIFAALTGGSSSQHRRTMALRSVAVASGILIVFALVGSDLLKRGRSRRRTSRCSRWRSR